MSRSKVDWADYSLNPVSGCLNDCPYCYARVLARRFGSEPRLNQTRTDKFTSKPAGDEYPGKTVYELDKMFLDENGHSLVWPFGFEPTFHRYRLMEVDKIRNGANIFVGAVADIFGPWVPEEWIMEIFETCDQHDRHNYMFLTKYPERYGEIDPILPKKDNFWYGTTITRNDDLWRINLLPAKAHTFLSIEPIQEDILLYLESLQRVGWVIIGAETGNRRGKVKPEFEWIKRIVLTADNYGIPVFMKKSLLPVVGEENMRTDFPAELSRKGISSKTETKLYAWCLECGKKERKKDMVSLRATHGIHHSAVTSVTICWLCRSCYEKWCRYHKIENRTDELFKERITKEEVPNGEEA